MAPRSCIFIHPCLAFQLRKGQSKNSPHIVLSKGGGMGVDTNPLRVLQVNMHLHLTKWPCTHRDIFTPFWYLPLKTYECLRMRWPILAFFCMSKRLHLGVLVRIYISQNGPVLTEISSPPQSGTCHLKTYQCSRMRWLILAFFHALKRLHLSALVHIYISQNSPTLTEICSPVVFSRERLKTRMSNL